MAERAAARTRLALRLLLVAILVVAAGGCGLFKGSGGQIEVVSLGDSPARLAGDLRSAVYRHRDANTATIILSDLPMEDLVQGRFADGRIICIDMHWRPKAGATPLDRTATNCTVRQVIFSGEALGVYDGAGFLAPSSGAGEKSFAGSISGATLRLAESTGTFADLLGAAELNGSFAAARDDAAVNQIAVRLNTEATRRLGRLFYVVGY